MKQRVPVLIPFLVVVATIFIGILIFAYFETKKANPQMTPVSFSRPVAPSRRPLFS
jgi:hypothetical protein